MHGRSVRWRAKTSCVCISALPCRPSARWRRRCIVQAISAQIMGHYAQKNHIAFAERIVYRAVLQALRPSKRALLPQNRRHFESAQSVMTAPANVSMHLDNSHDRVAKLGRGCPGPLWWFPTTLTQHSQQVFTYLTCCWAIDRPVRQKQTSTRLSIKDAQGSVNGAAVTAMCVCACNHNRLALPPRRVGRGWQTPVSSYSNPRRPCGYRVTACFRRQRCYCCPHYGNALRHN
jgi:hypothetical protein